VPEQPDGPVCHFELARVTYITDGDTIDVDLLDDNTTSPIRVRLTGINAMEQTVYSHKRIKRRGECHALEATQRLDQLIDGSLGIVRLAAQDPNSHSGARIRRSVGVMIDGQWQDAGRILLAEGHALFLANNTEWAWNRTYSQLTQQAANAGVGLWNTEYCAGGPPAAVKLWVHWDQGDGSPAGDEWVRIKNLDTAPVWLDGWYVRDSALRRFVFPPGTIVPPGGSVRLRVGAAPAPDLSWNLPGAIFDNATFDERAIGDGAYLFDHDGDLRAWQMYPCREACTDPNQGAFDIQPQPYGRETISLRNTRDTPVDLESYQLSVGPRAAYPFPGNSIVGPGETMLVRIGGSPGTDTRLEKHWPRGDSLLRNAGGTAVLKTFDEIRLACAAWGTGRC
jgi:endonuclease YncB( thermonuclease family)